MSGMGSKSLICSFILILALAGIIVGSCSKGPIPSVKDWVVKIATDTGVWISERGKNLYSVVREAFYEIRIEDGIKFSIDDPLVGQCVEDRILTMNRDDLGINMEINLKGRKMRRQDEFSPWMIDRDALPEELKEYWNIVTI